MGKCPEAIWAFKQSLSTLPESDLEYRFGALQNMGLAYVEQSDIDSSRACLGEMKQVLPGECSELVSAAALHLEGEIAFKTRDYSSAEKCFRAAYGILLEGPSAPQLAVICLRLAGVLFISGKLEDLKSLAKELMPLAFRFRHNKLIDAAVGEFIAAALAGRLTAEFMEAVLDRVGGSLPRVEAPPC
jgi:hypothetical protein